MTLIETITDPFVNYYNALPQESCKKVVTSFGIVFVLKSVLEGNPNASFYCAVLTATAATIYTLITPIMREIVNNRPQFSVTEEMHRAGFAYVATSMLATAFTDESTFRKLGLKQEFYYVTLAVMAFHFLRAITGKLSLNTNETNWLIFYPDTVT
ncbi:MAG: hypothetical protein K2X50_09760 [Gammaproteobacteria bacterium]|nr:hypothetical protein [Gammaproteobacteria bacterium]